jgi:hypothetical protein
VKGINQQARHHAASNGDADSLADLRAAVAFLDQMRECAKNGEDTTLTGIARDAREWLERAARAAIAENAGSAS